MPLILATAVSRLHADLIVVRLKQAGVPTDTVSVIHPLSSCPNSATCWLQGSTEITLSSGLMVAIAGSLGNRLTKNPGRPESSDLAKRLAKLGAHAEDTTLIEETLLENRFVLAVDLVDEQMQDVVLEILHRGTAERVLTVTGFRSEARPAALVPSADFGEGFSLNYPLGTSQDRNAFAAAAESASSDVDVRALAALLTDACAELRRLETAALDMGKSSALPATTYIRSSEIAVLRAVADEGCAAISRRLRALGLPVPEIPEQPTEPTRSPKGSRRVRSLVAVYRKCSRRLCAALQEARRTSDAATATVLRGLILRLEKQLWLLDSLSGSAQEDRSVLGIFLAC